MIITMLAMVHICTLVRAKNEIIASKPKTFVGKLNFFSINIVFFCFIFFWLWELKWFYQQLIIGDKKLD